MAATAQATDPRLAQRIALVTLTGAAAIAVAGGVSPLLAIAVAVAAGGAIAAIRRPALALAALVAVEVSNASSVVGSHGGVSLASAALTVSLLVLWRCARRHEIRFPSTPVVGLALLLLVASALAQLTGANATGLGTLGGLCRDLIFLAVVLTLLQLTGRVREAVMLAVAIVAALAALSVVQEYVFHNATTFAGFSQAPLAADIGGVTARHSGPEADVNFWGRTLVLFLPLALSLALVQRLGRRALWVGAALAILAGEYLTGSRGGYLAAAAALLVWVLLAGRRTRRLLLLAPIVVPLLLALPGVGSRLGTLVQAGNPAAANPDPSLLGRLAAQHAAAAMFADHPLTGVGPGQFAAAEPDYLRRPGGIATDQILAPHDLYLQVAAEEGVVGLVAWLFFFGGVLVLAARTLASSRRKAAWAENRLAAGALAGLAGWGVASIFLHLADFRVLLFVVAVVATLDARVRDLPEPAPVSQRPALVAVNRRRAGRAVPRKAVAAAGVVALVAAGTAAGWAAGSRRSHPTATQAATDVSAAAQLAPVQAVSNADSAYGYDLLTRQQVLPTYVAITSRVARQVLGEVAGQTGGSGHFRVTVTGVPQTALVRVSATGPGGQTLMLLPFAVIARTNALLEQDDPLFRLLTLIPASES